ncbi:hypothetical protein ABPG73_000556 [Tetrahymena malaccensis]
MQIHRSKVLLIILLQTLKCVCDTWNSCSDYSFNFGFSSGSDNMCLILLKNVQDSSALSQITKYFSNSNCLNSSQTSFDPSMNYLTGNDCTSNQPIVIQNTDTKSIFSVNIAIQITINTNQPITDQLIITVNGQTPSYSSYSACFTNTICSAQVSFNTPVNKNSFQIVINPYGQNQQPFATYINYIAVGCGSGCKTCEFNGGCCDRGYYSITLQKCQSQQQQPLEVDLKLQEIPQQQNNQEYQEDDLQQQYTPQTNIDTLLNQPVSQTVSEAQNVGLQLIKNGFNMKKRNCVNNLRGSLITFEDKIIGRVNSIYISFTLTELKNNKQLQQGELKKTMTEQRQDTILSGR